MNLLEDVLSAGEALQPERFSSLYDRLDPALIEEALEATGTATLRKRRLPASQVVWLAIGMALYRGRSIADVAASLDLALPSKGRVTVASSALTQARQRVGSQPLEWLFSRTARTWGCPTEADRWHGLTLYAADGTKVAVPDTPENSEHFGHHGGGATGRLSTYPLMRIASLVSVRSRIVVGARAGPFAKSELSMVTELIAELPEDSLVILDRLFFSSAMLLAHVARPARHFLLKLRKHAPFTVLKTFGPGDALVEVEVSGEARQKDPNLPKKFVARCLTYTTESATHELLTSLVDPVAYPADEIRALYHERWEVELSYDEFKTDLLEQEVTLRSRTMDGVYQELWGALLAYNLIRVEIAAVATEAKVSPNRISFVAAAWRIREEFHWCSVASPGAIPKHLRNLRADLTRMILPPRRSDRRYARQVKVKESPYAKAPRRKKATI